MTRFLSQKMKPAASVAAFNRITSQYKISLYYGDSTGFAKTSNPELSRRGDILLAGTSFATELNEDSAFKPPKASDRSLTFSAAGGDLSNSAITLSSLPI